MKSTMFHINCPDITDDWLSKNEGTAIGSLMHPTTEHTYICSQCKTVVEVAKLVNTYPNWDDGFKSYEDENGHYVEVYYG